MLLGCTLGMVACGGTDTSSATSDTSTESSTSSSSGGFSFPTLSDSSSSSESSSSSSRAEPVAYLLATVDHDAELGADDGYVIEAEDCDTSGCTLQAGCSSFFEAPGEAYPTSGNECLAAIEAPSDLTFKIEVMGTCDITFYTVSAKYENPWDLDSNVSYYLDDNDPFVTGYSSFGPDGDNRWYNWQTIELGTVTGVTVGTHQFHINVMGAFPNTDCFYLVVNNYTSTTTEA